MRTVWSGENTRASEGCWKIFSDAATNPLEREVMLYYSLDRKFCYERPS